MIAFVVLLALPDRLAEAGPVPYSGSVAVSAAPGPGDAPAGGAVVASRSVPFLLIDIRFDAAYDLTLENSVVRRADTGTLDFYYRVRNDSARPLRLVDVDTGPFTRAGSFDPVDVGVGGGGRVGPVLADRGNSHVHGVVLSFPFFDELAPGERSRPFFVRTTATEFELAGLTQFRSTPGLSSTGGNGFALTYGPVLDGPLVPPPLPAATLPLPAGGWAGLVLGVLVWGGRKMKSE